MLLCDGKGLLLKFWGGKKRREEALLLPNQVQTCFQSELFNSPCEYFDFDLLRAVKKATLQVFYP